jgi:hypothetical protein
MENGYQIIWDKKLPKAVAPTANISARVIALNETAAEPLKDSTTVCLGFSEDKKTIFVKAYNEKADQEFIPYPIKARAKSFSISCGKFIEVLGLQIEARKRVKGSVTVKDNMVIISL